MNNLQNAAASEQTFTQFLFYNRRNRIILYVVATAIIIQFAIFKYLYPFSNYIYYDSYSYLIGADKNMTINFYPIGYSKFLRLISVFAKPDIVLVSLQYLFIQCSTIFLLFTIFYFYKTYRLMQIVLYCFTIANPLLLYLGNTVSSDGIFLALSMTWFALLLWIIYKPSNKIIYWHAIVLFAAFTVRYNALIYPFISLIAFSLSTLPFRKKILGLGLGLLLIGWFVGLSMYQYKKLSGYWQFSPFSGWLMANNALFAYREVDSANLEPVPLKFRALDYRVRNFKDIPPDFQFDKNGAAYMWVEQSPLMQYNYSLFKANEIPSSYFKKWAGIGPFYNSYGLFIIKKYPMHFLRYYIWPNSLKYLTPPVEYLGYYNMGLPTVLDFAVKWFGYTNNQVTTRIKNGKSSILKPYPYLISITYLVMLIMLLSYILLKGWQYNPSFNKSILLAGFAWAMNAGFSIFTCTAALRFVAFPALLSGIFALLLIDWTARVTQSMKSQSQLQESNSNLLSAS